MAPIISTFGCQDSVVSLDTRVDLNKGLRTFTELFCHANAKHTAACIHPTVDVWGLERSTREAGPNLIMAIKHRGIKWNTSLFPSSSVSSSSSLRFSVPVSTLFRGFYFHTKLFPLRQLTLRLQFHVTRNLT